jgi:hypothetical protein
MNAARSDPPTPRSRARARVAQRQEQERAGRKRERSIRRRERRERRSEEFRLREQQGLSSPGTEEYSSLGEAEEESDGGRAPLERWEPSPPFAQSRGGGEGDDAWGGHRSAHCQATYERGDARCRNASVRRGDGRGCGGGHAGGGDNVRRAPEEKEKGIFHPEVSGRFPSSAFLDWPGPKLLVFVLPGWRPLCPLLRLPRCGGRIRPSPPGSARRGRRGWP